MKTPKDEDLPQEGQDGYSPAEIAQLAARFELPNKPRNTGKVPSAKRKRGGFLRRWLTGGRGSWRYYRIE